jgi:hypothetical protein
MISQRVGFFYNEVAHQISKQINRVFFLSKQFANDVCVSIDTRQTVPVK